MKILRILLTVLPFFVTVMCIAQPVANAGKDRVIYLPYNKIDLKGTETHTAPIVERKWELISGTATLGAVNDSLLTVSDITQGEYIFRYTVKDNVGATSTDEVKVTATFIDVVSPRATDPGRIKTAQFPNGKTLVTEDDKMIRGYWEAGYKGLLDEYYNNPSYFKNLRNLGFNAVKVWWDNMNVGGRIVTDVNDADEVAASLVYMDTIVNMASRYGLHIMIEGGNISYYQNLKPEVLDFRVRNMKQWWSILARRYKDRTHVSYEMQNEPIDAVPANYPVVADTKSILEIMRSQAPESQIMLFAFFRYSAPMLIFVDDLNAQMTIDWNKTTVAFHGYGTGDLSEITALRAKYPVIITEFWPEKGQGSTPWPTTDKANAYEMEGLEKEQISWFSWTTKKTETYDQIFPSIFADLKTRGVMWDFTPVDFKEPVIEAQDSTIFEPANSITVDAVVTASLGRNIVKYEWQLRKSTGTAYMSQNGPSVTLTSMTNGIYWLRLYAYDDAGYYSCKDIQVVLTKLHQIPGKIEAEEFSSMFNIGTEKCFDTDGGLNVGWIALDSYMDYAVNIQEAGMYSIELREAGAGGVADGGVWKLLLDGAPVTPIIKVPGTGGYQIFKTIYSNAILPQGIHTLRFNCLKTGSNINWYRFTKTNATIQVSPDRSFTLPKDSVHLNVIATDPSGIKSYNWTLLQGKSTAVISNGTTENVTITKLEPGEYLFNVAAITNTNIEYNANVKVTVAPCLDVVTVNAGLDVRITLPENSVELQATADAASGIATYAWKQKSGVPATMENANTNTLKLSGLLGGKVYYFIVTATSNGGCFATDEVKVTVFDATGIDNLKSDIDLSIYPNPARNTLTIARQEGDNSPSTLKLTDISGKILKQEDWSTDKTTWNVSQFAKGLYFISIFSNEKVTHKRLFIE